VTSERDPDVPEYAGCRSVRGEWGKVCPDCGHLLPKKPKPTAEAYARALYGDDHKRPTR
jgi:hypothetical protein